MPRLARVVALTIAATVAAPATARADLAPFVMARLRVAREARVAAGYLGATDAHGASLLLGYAHPVGDRLAVSGEAGLAWATRDGADGWSLANVTVGGLYLLGVSGRRTTGARLAATVPVASDAGSAALPGAIHGALRVADGERFSPAATTLVLAGAVRLGRTKSFVQAEAGVQARVRLDGDDDLWLRAGLAGGVTVLRELALVAELTTISGILAGGLGDPPEDFRHTLDLGLRLALPSTTLALRLQVPLDRSLRDQDVFLVALDATFAP